MSSNSNKGFFANLRYDFPASIIVFLVAMPLCLGVAMASGAPLFSGIIAGIVGGIVVALISGSPLGVSGPAAGLTAIVLSAIQELGTFETFLLAVVIAGIIQIILGLLKAGVIGYYFPSSIIKGMLTGIGIIIILKQIPQAFGYIGGESSVEGLGMFDSMMVLMSFVTPTAIIITTISMFVLILWEQPFMKRISLFKFVQGPLVVVVGGIGLNLFFQSQSGYELSGQQLVNLPVPDSLGGFFQQFTFPDFTQLGNKNIYIIAFTIAIVASLETLLSVEATDKLDPQKRVTDTNRELFAQGVGNIVSGLIGGLPVTQVIVRSSANVQSGGRSKASAVFHGLLLLISALTIPNLLNLIPLSSLAAILIVIGFKLAKPSLFKEMFDKGPSQFVPFAVTVAGILIFDLLMGIGLGMVVAIFHILWNNFKVPYSFVADKYEEGKPLVLHLAEHVSFINKAAIQQALDHIPEHTHVIIDATKTKTIHPDVLEIFDDFQQHAKTIDIEFEIQSTIPLGEKNGDSVREFENIFVKRRA